MDQTIPLCLSWPDAAPAPPPEAALPNVPTLIFSGADDLRTPTSGARAVAAQIRENDAIARGESIGGGEPEFVINGMRMQKDNRRSFTQHAIDNVGIAAPDGMRLERLHLAYEVVARWTATGAANNSGSSGITIQAMG